MSHSRGGKGKVLKEAGWITRPFEQVTISMCVCLHVLSTETERKWDPEVTFHHRNVGVPEERNEELMEGQWRGEGRERGGWGSYGYQLLAFLLSAPHCSLDTQHSY